MLVSSGYISMGGIDTNRSINGELQQSYFGTIGLNDTNARKLAGKPTNASEIALLDFYGKNYQFVITDPTGGGKVFYDVDLAATAVAAGWDGNAKLVFIIGNPGLSLSPENQPVFTSYYINTPSALYIQGTYPNGIEIRNYGYIVGKGGKGGAYPAGTKFAGGYDGQEGQSAMTVLTPVTIYNHGVIGGGGGGGGGGRTADNASAGGGAGGACFGETVVGAYYAGYVSPTVTTGGISGKTLDPPYGGYGQDRWGYNGGDGGNLGQPGTAGSPADAYITIRETIFIEGGGAGGAGGAAIRVGNQNITWALEGTIYGARY